LHTAVTELPRPVSFHASVGLDSAAQTTWLSTSLQTLRVAVGFAPVPNLEVFASASRVVNTNVTANMPASLTPLRVSSGVSNVTFGATGMLATARGLALGATVRGELRAVDGAFDLTFVRADFRLQGTLDFAALRGHLPLRIHANAGYTVDNSSGAVAGVEDQRRMAISGYDPVACSRAPTTDPTDPRNNNPACNAEISSAERYTWQIQRADWLWASLALDAVFGSTVQLRPFVEYTLGVPVLRSGYVCWEGVVRPIGFSGDCLADPGNNAFSSTPSFFTLGLRASVPAWAGLSAQVAMDIATGGSTSPAREVAPIAPWSFYAAAGISL
jgi:hypothetical protein